MFKPKITFLNLLKKLSKHAKQYEFPETHFYSNDVKQEYLLLHHLTDVYRGSMYFSYTA